MIISYIWLFIYYIFLDHHQLPSNLPLFIKNSVTWYVDATFKAVKKPFMQIFGIHVFLKYDLTQNKIVKNE